MFSKEKKEKKCPKCKGSGKVWWANFLDPSDCPSCGGSGKVKE